MTDRARTPYRRVAQAGGLVLVAALLPLLGPSAPAHAAGCQSELPVLLPPSACDDTTPPETTLQPMSPAPNAKGWTDSADVTFTFSGTANDASDSDPVALECKLEGPSQAHDWETCTSPRTYEDLADTPENASYTFSVRAYDGGDRPIAYDDPSTLPPPIGEPDVEVADEDATPETATWKQDTVDPSAFVFGGPYDSEGTGWPIAPKPQVTYTLDASEPQVDYRCQLDGRDVDCGEGRVTLKGLSGGNHTFAASVTDRAGNSDDSPATKQVVVPHDLGKGRFWRKVKAKGYFGGDVMHATKPGGRIKFRARNIREFRVLAPAGKDLGKIRVRVGTGFWKTYDLSRPKATKQHWYVVRDAQSPLFSGRILVESLARKGHPVRVDALVFPPG